MATASVRARLATLARNANTTAVCVLMECVQNQTANVLTNVKLGFMVPSVATIVVLIARVIFVIRVRRDV